MSWPARYLWISSEGSKIDAEAASAARRESGSLSSRLAQRQRPGGVVATPLFADG